MINYAGPSHTLLVSFSRLWWVDCMLAGWWLRSGFSRLPEPGRRPHRFPWRGLHGSGALGALSGTSCPTGTEWSPHSLGLCDWSMGRALSLDNVS